MVKLLWIDDDEALIDNTTPIFLKYGFYILKATNTSRALTILRQENVDGILLDVRLRGDESGLELLEDIQERYPDIKIAIFTAYPEYDDHINAENSGAMAYLEKIEKSIPLDPIKQSRFFNALHQIFKETNMEEKSMGKRKAQPKDPIGSLWGNGLFFLLTFIIIVVLLGVLARTISPILLPIILIAAALLYTIVGAFILRAQGNQALSQKNFIELMGESLRLLPLLKSKPKEPYSPKKGANQSAENK